MVNKQIATETYYILLGQENFTNGNYEQAKIYFQYCACYNNPFQAIAQYRIAQCNIKLKQFKSAIEDIKAYIGLNGKNKAVLKKLVYCYLENRQTKKAIDLYCKAENIDLKNVTNDLGGVYNAISNRF